MRTFGIMMPGALNRVRRMTRHLASMGRLPLTFAMVASLMTSASPAPMPAHADTPPDPAARLQVIVKSIHIIDDTDSIGSGELKLHVVVAGPTPDEPPDSSGGLAGFDYAFSADSGDDVPLDRVVPRDGDAVRGGATAEAGIPVYAGRKYDIFFEMVDRDPFDATERMGIVTAHLDEARNWAVGTYTVRSLHEVDSSPGDYTVTFEIRRTPLPDLTIRTLREINAGDGQFFCAVISNIGDQLSPPAPLAIRANGVLVRAVTLSALDAGQTTEHCAIRTELPAAEHQLRFIVDEGRQIPEMSETDNAYEWKIPALAAPVTAVPVGVNDAYTVAANTTLNVPAPGVLANDTDLDSQTLQAAVKTGPSHGTLTLQPNGAFSYTPMAGFSGTDTFTYTASDAVNFSAPTTVTITVTASPASPGARDDTFTVAAGSTLNVPAPGVLGNDTDPGSPTLQAAVGQGPAHGTLALQPNGAFSYTPAGGFSGTDSFTYRATDQTNLSATATVTIAVTPLAPASDCAPRPPVRVTPTVSGGKLTAHIQVSPLNTQQPNSVRTLRFGALQNARVTVGGQPIASGQSVTVPAGSSGVDVTVERATPGQAITVPLTVMDGCGEWQTFVGGGPGAF